MKSRKRNGNHTGYLADSMFYGISLLVSVDAFLSLLLHTLGVVLSPWMAIFGLAICAAVSWTVYVLHKLYVMPGTNSLHISAFLGTCLLLFFCLYNPHQFTGVWMIFLLFPIFLSFFHDRALLLIWGSAAYLIYVLTLGLEQNMSVTIDALFDLSLAGISAACAWIGYVTIKKVLGDSRKAAEEHNREYAMTLLNTLVPIVERKTQSSSKEIEQMGRLIKRILREFPLEKVNDWEINMLSLLHYVSRIKWPDYVFESDERLTTYEYQIIQEHCHIGSEMFHDKPAFARVVKALYSHHERYDGSGYPQQLKGEEIPLLAQILGIVECFLAMTTPRAYREAVTLAEAYEEICSMAGNAYDEKVVQAFASAVQIHSPTKVSHVPRWLDHSQPRG
ncbi:MULTISPECIES: HD domain-containing phosphohydrolase [Brevibacillus]|uniref:HD-GYP domain-containing protein n=1 Tax=Brevibacillus invocatus TaxID=173959 RepID=A0A3M8C8L3_9BACL|nr:MULTISPECIES: HD domain-containing phosphohydrolase [Brevibacillus]MDH4617825.1 hypothetical protein [Brevibacillus sp. AY1]RNB71949.1 hypothetical protein EDM52_14385 [Brevibacillus invocatus]